jgi:hypothetical protein
MVDFPPAIAYAVSEDRDSEASTNNNDDDDGFDDGGGGRSKLHGGVFYFTESEVRTPCVSML